MRTMFGFVLYSAGLVSMLIGSTRIIINAASGGVATPIELIFVGFSLLMIGYLVQPR